MITSYEDYIDWCWDRDQEPLSEDEWAAEVEQVRADRLITNKEMDDAGDA